MNIVIFFTLAILYVIGCYLFARLYFYLVANIFDAHWPKILKHMVIGLCALVFVIVDIPTAIFFPAWLSMKTGFLVDSSGREPTSMLILVGIFVLVSTVLLAWRSKDGQRFERSRARRW